MAGTQHSVSRQGYGGNPNKNQQLVNQLNQRYGPSSAASHDDVSYATGRYKASGTDSLNNYLQNNDVLLGQYTNQLKADYDSRIADLDARASRQRETQIQDLANMTSGISHQRENIANAQQRRELEMMQANRGPTRTGPSEQYQLGTIQADNELQRGRMQLQASLAGNRTQERIAETQAMTGLLGSALQAGFSGYGNSSWRWF